MGFSLATIVSYTKKLLQYTHTIIAYELHQKDYDELKAHLLRENNILFNQYIISTKQLADHRYRMRQLQRMHQHLKKQHQEKITEKKQQNKHNEEKLNEEQIHNEEQKKGIQLKSGRNKVSDTQPLRTRITKFNNEAEHKDADLKEQRETEKPTEKDKNNFEKILGPVTAYQLERAAQEIQQALNVMRSILIQLWQQIITEMDVDGEEEEFEYVQLFSKSKVTNDNSISISLKAKLTFWIERAVEYNRLCNDIIKLETCETQKHQFDHCFIAWEEILYRAADARIEKTYATSLPTSDYRVQPKKNGTFYEKLTTTDKLRCPAHVTYTFDTTHPQHGATNDETHTYIKQLCDEEYSFFTKITQFMDKKLQTYNTYNMALLSAFVRRKKTYASIADITLTNWTQPQTVYSSQPKHIYYIYFVEQIERTIHHGIYMLPTTLFSHADAYDTTEMIHLEEHMNPSLQVFFKQVARPIRVTTQPDVVATTSDTRICSILWLRAFQDIVLHIIKQQSASVQPVATPVASSDFFLTTSPHYHLLQDSVGLSYISPLLTFLVNFIYSRFIFQCHFPKLSILSMYHSDLTLLLNMFAQLTHYEPTHEGVSRTFFSIDKTNYILYHNEQAAEQKVLDRAHRHASTHYSDVVVPSPSSSKQPHLVPSPKQEPHVRHFLSCLQTLRTLLGAIQDKFNHEMKTLSISFWKAEHALYASHAKKKKSGCLPFLQKRKKKSVSLQDHHPMQLAIQQIIDPAFKSITKAFHPSRRNMIHYLLSNLIDAYLTHFVAEPWIDRMTNDFFILREFILDTPLLHSSERDAIRSYDCYRFFSMLVRTRMATLNHEAPQKQSPLTPPDSPTTSALTIDEFSSTTRSSYDHYSHPSHVHITMTQASDNKTSKSHQMPKVKPTMHSHTSSVDECLSPTNSTTLEDEEPEPIYPQKTKSSNRRSSGTSSAADPSFKPRILTHSASTDHLLRYNRVIPIEHPPLQSHNTSPNGIILTSK
mmetsp:Transcript_8714/g.12880  ORF Transcript_8714/g.12880 Transcript_8714/m.12880 type:complete len:991 (+) Transcript_8714:88-3060(+)